MKQDESKKFAQPRRVVKAAPLAGMDEQELVVRLSQGESEKILRLAREQLGNVEEGADDDAFRKKVRTTSGREAREAGEEDDSSIEDDEDDERLFEEDDGFQETVFAEITEEDERAIAAFSKKNNEPGQRKTLGEIIMEKLAERQAEQSAAGSQTQPAAAPAAMNPKVVEVYTSVGTLMHRYRSGKIAKAFKIIPSLKNWEQILGLTHPEKWSPQGMYQATRLFASNMNPKMAQRFYYSVLLPAVRNDIQENHVLNYHLYMSLKKSLYKPASFFKGILFPLCEEDCTLREAAIISSILAKVSIPVVHAGAALLKISTMPYSGATSTFLRVLINKKYSLPYRVVDALVNHFCSFTDEKRELPVLWHQALLVFAQRYRNVISPEQKERFKALLKKHAHKQLTSEIRRELFSASSA